MTVSSQTSNDTFYGNGVTTIWPLPFRFFDDADVFVYLIDPVALTTTPLALGTDYTLSGAGLPEQFGTAPGAITTTVPVANGMSLYVERSMGIEQLTDIVNQGRFFPEVHEDVFDRLTMLIQQNAAGLKGAIRVAVADPEPARLPVAALRANLLMGFDALGNPIPVAPVGGSSAALALLLANEVFVSQGAAMIGRGGQVVNSIAELKTLLKGSPSKHAFATGYRAQGDGGGGPYSLDVNDTTSAEIPGIIVVAADGGRWKLVQQVPVSVKQMGAIAGVDDAPTQAINNAVFLAARNWVAANPYRNRLTFTPGTYGYSTSSNWAISDAEISFEGEVRLRYFGTGNAVVIDAGPLAGDLCYNLRFGATNRPIIECPATALDTMFVRSVHHSKVGMVPRGAGTGRACLHVQFAVCTEFNVTPSVNEAGWYLGAKPAVGIQLDQRLTNETTSYCYFPNAIVEGPDIGIHLISTLGNLFVGGTSEACSQYGVFAAAGASGDRFIGMDFEANTIADAYVLGKGIEFISCDSDHQINFGSTAQLGRVQGGRHKDILLDTGSAGCAAVDTIYNRSNNGGTLIDTGTNSIVKGVRNGGTNAIYLTGSKTYDPPSIPTGTAVQTTVTVPGLKFGDTVVPGFTQSLLATSMSASVSAADTATVTIVNVSGVAVDLPSGTLSCTGFRGN